MVAPNTIENPGSLNAASGDVVDATGGTTDPYVSVFSKSNSDGYLGVGTIINDGANDLNVRETVTDKFGNTVSVVTLVTAGSSYLLDLQTNFLSGGTAYPPFTDYEVEVQSASAGNATTYELHFVDLTPGNGGSGGGGSSVTLEIARLNGDTFLGDVYWDDDSKAIFGKASGEADQDYLQIYSDKTNHLQVFDSAQDGVAPLRSMSWQMGGAEKMRLTPNGQLLIAATAVIGAEIFRVNGAARVDGKLTVTGAIDPTSLSLSGTAEGVNVLYFDSDNGQSAALSAAGHGRIRYNNALTRWEQSVNGGAYAAFGGGGGPGSDTTAWHNAGDSYAANSIIGNLNAGPNDLTIYNNNEPWFQFHTDGSGNKNILVGDSFTTTIVDGAVWQYKRTDSWTNFYLKNTQDGSAGQGTGESLIGLANDIDQQVVINMVGSNFAAGPTYGYSTSSQARIRTTADVFVIGNITKKDLVFFTDNIPFVKFDLDQHVRTLGPTYIGGYSDVTPNIANEFLRVKGIAHVDTFLGIGANLTIDPTFTLQMRRDAADINTGIVIDNRNAAGQPFFTMGNDPRGSNAAWAMSYDNATDNVVLQNTQLTACTTTIGNVGNNSFIIKTNNTAALTIAGSHAATFASTLSATAGFFNTTSGVANEVLRAAGIAHVDSFLGIGANLTIDPTFTLQMRRDAADINTGIVIDNRDAAGQPFFTMGPNPRGANTSFTIYYDNATDNVSIRNTQITNTYTTTFGNVGASPINFVTNNATQMTLAGDGGLVCGAATGGSKGAGTINVATNIYLNNTAYANPDYAFEYWATGRIEKFAANKGAEGYTRWSLEEMERYCRENFRLPGIDALAPGGVAERFDFLLEKVEELFTHFFDLKKELRDRMAVA